MVTVFACPNVTTWRDPATAVAWSACTARSTAPTESGVVLRRLDSLIRTAEPPMVVCTTMRRVSFEKSGPPMVMLGPHVAVRGTCAAVAPGATNTAASNAATEPIDVIVMHGYYPVLRPQ
jgi:hypothetical protein